MRIVISSGHGKHVNGAVNLINERDENRIVTRRVCELLRGAGVDVVEFHEDEARNQRDNVNSIVRFHNSQVRDLDVSIHFNAVAGTREEAIGVETMYLAGHEKMRPLASAVSRAISVASGLTLRRIDGTWARNRGEIGFLTQLHNSILIEVCFVNSVTDVRLYREKFEAICRAIAESISDRTIDVVPGETISQTCPDDPNCHALPDEEPETMRFDLHGTIADIPGRIIDDRTHVQARQLLETMGYEVDWDDSTRTVIVRGGAEVQTKPCALSAKPEAQAEPCATYAKYEGLTDIDILRRIVWAEARGEDEKGQILIVNVILNRVRHPHFPNSIRDVVFQDGQFAPVRNGAFDAATPTQKEIDSVNLAIDGGVDHSQGVLFFENPRRVTADTFHGRAEADGRITRLFDHGNHRFWR